MAQINPTICLRIGAKNDTSKHINQNNALTDYTRAKAMFRPSVRQLETPPENVAL